MNSHTYFPQRFQGMEEHFRKLRKTVLAETESEFEKVNPFFSETEQSESGFSESALRWMKQLGISPEELQNMDEKEPEKLKEFLAHVDSRLGKREVDADQVHKEQVARMIYAKKMGGREATMIGSDLISSEKEDLKDIQGVAGVGNPSVWFNGNPTGIQSSRHGTWINGHCFEVDFGSLKTVKWWFQFTPQQTGQHWILAGLPYAGYYILRAHDDWFYCKQAGIYVWAEIRVHQYFWRPSISRQVFNMRRTHADLTDFISGYDSWDFYTNLVAGNELDDQVTIEISFSIVTTANGRGSYAKVDFDTGSGNYVGRPQVIIAP